MKRFFLYAMMTAGMLASCSQSENEGLSGDETDMLPSADKILISASAPIAKIDATPTRSSGSIGADKDDLHGKWNNEILHIYACQKDPETGITRADKITTTQDTYVLFDEKAKATGGSDRGDITWLEGTPSRYFPRNGAYDFFGYYADNAISDGTVAQVKDGKSGNGNKVLFKEFTITGAEDLMVAKAKLTDEQKPNLDQIDYNKAFSSYTARRGVQPSMTFEHLLTRLVFFVDGEGNAAPEKAYVKSVTVKSKTTGELAVVYSDEDDKGIVWTTNDADRVPLALKERGDDGQMIDLVPANSYAPRKDDPAKTIGEALLVEPEVESYEITVTIRQEEDANGNPIDKPEDTFTRILKASDVTTKDGTKLDKFKASNSYNITISVYGVEKVEIEAVLGAWGEGGSASMNPDEFTDVQ
ncbi:fimbrillin family protein [Bacteroides difficilis]|uniref:fimbrillin family protein n=1 Tax=Bacteroides difficilis TaxID=2763021 RepID=UPI003AADCB40